MIGDSPRRLLRLPSVLFRPDASRPVDVSGAVHLARNIGTVALCYIASLPFTAGLLSTSRLPPAFMVPSAILLSALLLIPAMHWWLVIIATLVAHVAAAAVSGDLLRAIPGFASNAACALASAALCRRFVDLDEGLGSLRDLSSFMLIAALAPAICVLGPATVFEIGRLPDFAASQGGGVRAVNWTPWFVATLGFTLAYVTIVPAALAAHDALRRAIANFPRSVLPETRIIEAILLAVGVALSSLVTFGARPFAIPHALVLIAPLSLVLCAALRFRLAGAAGALLIVTFIAVNGVLAGAPGAFTASGAGLVLLQTALLALGTPLLLLGASMEERQRVYRRVARSDDRYALSARAGRVFLVSYDPGTGAIEADHFPGSILDRGPFRSERPGAWWRFVHPDDTAQLRTRLTARPWAGADDPPTDFRMVEPDGREHWFRMRELVPRVVAGESRMLAAMVDITDTRMAEQAVEQRTRELAHVARTATVGELAAALAHEIRQPLTAILINSQTAIRLLEAQGPGVDSVRDILQQIASDGRRASDVIQRMRTFARKGEPQRGLIDLNGIVREAVQLVRHDTIKRRVEIRFALSDEPLVVLGDRVQLQQVALNVVLNALEAAEQSPASARLVAIESARAAPHTAIVTVRDTGPGVAPDRIESIFAPFVTTKPNGMGMGLAISRTIVEAHGGVIWCESDQRAGGAAVSVAIPLGPLRNG